MSFSFHSNRGLLILLQERKWWISLYHTLHTQWSWQKCCLNHCARTCCSLRIVTRCRFMNWRIRCERGGRNVHFLSINLISFRRSRGIVLVMASPAREMDGAGRQWNAEKDVRNVRDFSNKRLPSGGTRSGMPQQTRYAGVCADWDQKLCVFWSRPKPHRDRPRHCQRASSLVQCLWLARFVQAKYALWYRFEKRPPVTLRRSQISSDAVVVR